MVELARVILALLIEVLADIILTLLLKAIGREKRQLVGYSKASFSED